MTSTSCFLGIDLGTSAVKVVLVGGQGRILASAGADYAIHHPSPGHVEQHPQDWWQATVRAVQAALHGLESRPEVAAIGLSGQMHGTVLVGHHGNPLCPAVIWPDRRSVDQVPEIIALLGAGRLIAITGSPMATGFQAATLRWFQQNLPGLLNRTEVIFLPKDYLRWRLTGEVATDPSDAAGTLLLNGRTRNWSSEILDALDIDPDLLPAVRPSQSVAGRLTEEAAAALGLKPDIPVVIGAADTACSALGAGAVMAGRLLLTVGSGGQLVLPVDEPDTDPRGRIHTFCSALEPTTGQPGWYQMGAILAAGLALRWLRDQVLNLAGDDAYTQMMEWAAQAPVGANGLIFLPYLSGQRTPHMDPNARGLFYGLTLEHGRSELIRSVVEGVTLACYDGYQVLVELGATPQEIVLAGGGAASRFWQQVVADVFDLPVQPLAVTQQSALGAALLAGAGSGHLALAAGARRWAQYGPTVQPNPDNRAHYAEIYAAFQAAYGQTRSLARRLRSPRQ